MMLFILVDYVYESNYWLKWNASKVVIDRYETSHYVRGSGGRGAASIVLGDWNMEFRGESEESKLSIC